MLHHASDPRSADDANRLTATQRDANCRRLGLIFGDQLDYASPLLDELDPEQDAILMMEVAEEAEHVPSHRQRTTLFLAAMRHYALDLLDAGWRVRYVQLNHPSNTHSFDGEYARALDALRPERVLAVHPGEHRIARKLDAWRRDHEPPVDVLPDTHFLSTLEEFADWAADRKELVLEYFYRTMRRKHDVLLTREGKPVGGTWNLDKQNRETFGKDGPPALGRERLTFDPDPLTEQVIRLVDRHFAEAWGRLDHFHWPVTRAQALHALHHFLHHRLPLFGDYQDAMWTDEPFLFHSTLSPLINLKLLHPREVLERTLAHAEDHDIPLNCLEGFIRQILGWREFIRDVYWYEGPDYVDRNALGQHGTLPDFYWTGETDMACMAQSLGQVVEHGYGHHIQRLMVTGNFAMIAGVNPVAVADWYLGMYVDGVDWATRPNVLGMAQYADGGVIATKPYAASGKYISRMSNYCGHCPYSVSRRTGEGACPFNVFFWDFLLRHRDRFKDNTRMAMMLRNVDRLDEDEARAIRQQANDLRHRFGIAD